MEEQVHVFWTLVIALCWIALLIFLGGTLAWWVYRKRRRERRRAAGRAARQLTRDWREGRLPTPEPGPINGKDDEEPKTSQRTERRKTWRID
ncbi:hypothetical protein [Variovorax sp. HJSM1_2]|uniref:hypothetical protein n=1 Tax=Variovorax sp. HJSM1_2 TaxID=3366263 RepID=UPI003BEDEAAD